MSFDALVWITALGALALAAILFWAGRLWRHEYSEPPITRSGRVRKTVAGLLMGFALFVLLGAFTEMRPPPKLEWQKDHDAAFALAKETGKPVFIDFWATWCKRCLEIERQSFARPEFLSAVDAYVPLKIDYDQMPEALEARYEIGGNLPTFVLATPDGERLKKLDGRDLGEGDATAFLTTELDAFARGADTGRAKGHFAEALEEGLLWAVLVAFLGGLATALTPCVYPMIPVTVSVIGGASQGDQKKAFVNSLVYVGGMALCYSTLGVTVAAVGGQFSALFQNAWFLVSIAVVFLLLGGHMLEIRKLGLLMRIQGRAGDVSGKGKGAAGIFLMGVLAGFVFAPCVGPVLLGVLTYIGQTRDVVLGFVFMFVFAVGMGLPFMLLGTFSGLLTKVRGTAGDWMIGVEAAFGAALVAAALYFLIPVPGLGPALTRVFEAISSLAV